MHATGTQKAYPVLVTTLRCVSPCPLVQDTVPNCHCQLREKHCLLVTHCVRSALTLFSISPCTHTVYCNRSRHVYSPYFPSFINFCLTTWHWKQPRCTPSGTIVCVSHFAEVLSFIDVAILRIRMTPAALCVLDTKNQHSALTVQHCLSAHSEVLSLTTKAILQDLCPASTGKMWIHHIISPIYWIKIGQFWFDLMWVNAPISSDDCFVFLNVVLSLLLLFSVSTTSHLKPTTSPTLFQTAEHKPKKAPPSRPVLFKNRPGLAASECPGTAVHLQCAPASKPGPGHQALGSEQGAAHKWVMAVTLTFGGRAG